MVSVFPVKSAQSVFHGCSGGFKLPGETGSTVFWALTTTTTTRAPLILGIGCCSQKSRCSLCLCACGKLKDLLGYFEDTGHALVSLN